MSRARQPLVAILIAAAIPVLLFGGWVTYLVAAQERSEARQAAYDTVQRVSDRVASDIAVQVQIAATLASSASLDEPNLTAFYREAARAKAAHPLWETVELVDLNGNQVVNLLRPLGSRLGPTADRASLEALVRTREPVVSGLGPVGPLSGKRLIVLRVPVIRAGELRYALSVALVPNAVSSILRHSGAPEGWIGAVVDASGVIIARNLSEDFAAGQQAKRATLDAIARAPEGVYTGETLEGLTVETVYRRVADTGGWSVHLGLPREVLDAQVNRSFLVMAGGGLASLALAAGLASLMARDIAQRQRDEELRAALALKLSEERGDVAVAAADLGTWRWDLGRGEIAGSARCGALLGLPVREGAEARWSAQAFLAAIHPEDRPAVEAAAGRGLLEGGPLDVEFRTTPDREGGPRWLRLTGRPAGLDSAEPHALHGVIADIDPRKRAEAERLDLLRRLAKAQDDEQRRISRELHDQVGQTVTGLSLGLKGLERTLQTSGAAAAVGDQLRWLQSLTLEIGREIHRAASDLRPTALDDLGLPGALAAYTSDWSDRHGVAADFQTVGNLGRLPAEVETAAYRIVQEALTNVLKHASARVVSVLLEHRPGELRVIVEDDGIGFAPEGDPEAAPSRPRLGLSGIRERLALLRGSLSLESRPGAGTTLFVQIPIPPQEPREAA